MCCDLLYFVNDFAACGEAALAADWIAAWKPSGVAALAADLITVFQTDGCSRGNYNLLASTVKFAKKQLLKLCGLLNFVPDS